MKYQIGNGLAVDICKGEMDMLDIMLSKTNAAGREDKDDAFFIGDLGCVIKQFQKWKYELPHVDPFYAVKCNMDPAVLSLLVKLGTGFDCASKAEIQAMLNLGVPPEKIIFANPCKQASHVRFAAAHGVSMMTFDNESELHKVKSIYPDAKLVIRIRVDDSKSLCQFGMKFGVDTDKSMFLLQRAKDLGLNVIGVSFHVGSGCCDALLYRDSLRLARIVFDQAENVGYHFTLLDIGGGFPGDNEAVISFEEAADVLKQGFKTFFPPTSFPNLRIIAEPGRFFVSAAFTSVCNIVSKRVVTSAGPESLKKQQPVEGFMYYLNDGVYGSFNCVLYDHHVPKAKALNLPEGSSNLFKCSVWGPTCDGLDCINKQVKLPKLDIGQWIYFENMGAYTMSAGSTFNGFPRPPVHYVISEVHWKALIENLVEQTNTPVRNIQGHVSIDGMNQYRPIVANTYA